MKIEIDPNKIYRKEANMLSQSNTMGIGTPLELSRFGRTKKSQIQIKDSVMGGGGGDNTLDISWLPAAAEVYNISKDISDYVLCPIPAVITSIPNTNGDSSTIKEMLKFKPDHGMQAYKTFRAKPTHVEHANSDYTIAKGVILDSMLKTIPGYDNKFARLILLLAFDRTRDPEIANAAMQDGATFSIGKWYNSFKCSHPECGHVCHKENIRFCSHTRLKAPTYFDGRTGHLIYRQCQDITGFECSYVGNPAYASAETTGAHLQRLNPSFVWKGQSNENVYLTR